MLNFLFFPFLTTFFIFFLYFHFTFSMSILYFSYVYLPSLHSAIFFFSYSPPYILALLCSLPSLFALVGILSSFSLTFILIVSVTCPFTFFIRLLYIYCKKDNKKKLSPFKSTIFLFSFSLCTNSYQFPFLFLPDIFCF